MTKGEALEASGAAADANFRAQPSTAPMLPCKQKTWVEVRLIDPDGKPVANERFRIELPDGTVHEGTTDAEGLGGLEMLDPGEGVLTLPDRMANDPKLES